MVGAHSLYIIVELSMMSSNKNFDFESIISTKLTNLHHNQAKSKHRPRKREVSQPSPSPVN
jgi:hypothetical protein